MDDRTVDTLFFFDDALDIDRFRASISAFFLVCEGDR
jgi:hypothetical protein